MKNKPSPVPEATRFWESLQSEAEELHHLAYSGQFAFVYMRINQLLSAAGFDEKGTDFVTEMTSKGKSLVLIFSPESNHTKALKVDRIVSLAPSIPNWIIYSHRQQRPWEDALAMLHSAFHVAADDATFEAKPEKNGFRVIMHSCAYDRVASVDRDDYVRFFLAHAIGEQTEMNRIRFVDLRPPVSDKSLLTPSEVSHERLA
jgi:hypothetical protein